MTDFLYPVMELTWSTDTGLTVPLYYYPNDGKLKLYIERWWRLKKAAALDIEESMDLLSGVIDSYNKLDSIRDTRKKILFTAGYPEWLFDTGVHAEPTDTNNVITWVLMRREPGTLGPRPFSRPQELKPRIREEIIIEDTDGLLQNVEVKGQWFDNLIRFDCWAPTPKEANDLARTFEELMFKSTDHMLRAGVQKIVFQGRSQDRFSVRARWPYRPVIYYYRTERIYVESDVAINSMSYEAMNYNGSFNIG